MEEVPPVPARLLMEYFDDPTCAGTSAKTLETFPKRISEMSGDEKYGWGLQACEYISFFRAIILCLCMLVGPIWFFLEWLVKHPGDLQNASVPLFLVFALIGSFIGTLVILPH